MNELDKGSNIGKKFESKEGERGPLSSNKANVRSPSLGYIYVINDSNVDKAFDILFNELIRNKNYGYKENSIVRQGIDSPAGRRTDNQDPDCRS